MMETPFPNELFQDTWDLTPDLQFPVTNSPSFFQLISPPSDQFVNHPYPYDDNFQPFLDALTSPEVFNSFYSAQPFLDALTSPEVFNSFYAADDDLPPMAIHEDRVDDDHVRFLENFMNATFEGEQVSDCFNDNVETGAQIDTPNIDVAVADNVSERKSEAKKSDGQPSKNLMAERRRRKRLNDRLSMLRSVVPKISKMDRTSILGDTIDYMRELLDKIHKLQEEGLDEIIADVGKIDMIGGYLKKLEGNDTCSQVRNPPKFDVKRRNGGTKVELNCAARPGLLLSTISTLEAFGLDIQHCVISCFSDFSMEASCFEVAEHRSLVSSEDVKLALFRNAGYGGRCV